MECRPGFPQQTFSWGDEKAAWEQQGDKGEFREIMPTQWSRVGLLAVDRSRGLPGLPKGLTLCVLVSPKPLFLLRTFFRRLTSGLKTISMLYSSSVCFL